MKKQRILFYGLLILAVTFLDACFDDAGTKVLFNDAGKATVEIQEATTAAGAVVERQYEKLGTNAAVKDSIRINLNGPQRATPVNVTFTLDPASTAVAGFHYTMVTTGTTVTIQPNTSYAYIRYNVFPDKMAIGEKWTLGFSITASDVKISVNYPKLTRTMLVICPSNLAGTYTTTLIDDTDFFGTNSTNASVTIARIAGSPNTYTMTDISAGAYRACCGSSWNVNQGASFGDVCNVITVIARTNAQVNIGPSVITKGSYNPITKVIIVKWRDTSNGSDDLTTTFTKLP